jgi:SAM-dependent methyltransferase
MTTIPEMDEGKAEAFAERMVGILNDASTAMLVSLGHRTGLFDVMGDMPPSSSQQIADAAKLNERYVREWLGGMVVSRIISYAPAGKAYTLPPEHAAFVTKAAGADNLATFTQFFPLFGLVEDKIVQSFQNGGGVPYSEYPTFQKIMGQISAMVHDASMVDVILPLVPGLIEKLEDGIDVADIGCGQGRAINVMARAFPNSRFVGYDFSDEGLSTARTEAAAWGLGNVIFEAQDVANLGVTEQYDFMTSFDAIHDQAKPGKVLAGIAHALKPGGTYLMVDEDASSYLEKNLDHPIGPLLFAFSVFHCMTVSLALGGEGLGTIWGVELAQEMLEAAGLTVQEIKRVDGDIENAYFITTKQG